MKINCRYLIFGMLFVFNIVVVNLSDIFASDYSCRQKPDCMKHIPYYLASIDAFGLESASSEEVQELLGSLPSLFITALNQQDDLDASALWEEMVGRLDEYYPNQWACLSYLEYPDRIQLLASNDTPVCPAYITVDFLPSGKNGILEYIETHYLRQPKESMDLSPQVSGILKEYFRDGNKLYNMGLISLQSYDTDDTHYAPFSLEKRHLAHWKPVLEKLAFEKEEEIIHAFLYDECAENRTIATYFLGLLDDKQKIADILQLRLLDADVEVRRTILQQFAFFAYRYPTIELPFSEILKRLEDIDVQIRGEALNVALAHLSQGYANPILKNQCQQHISTLIKLLRMDQPINHVPAYRLLKILSGCDFGEHNYDAWEQWQKTYTVSARSYDLS